MSGGGLGAWGESQLRGAVTGFFGNPYLRDYTHASKTFLPNSYENAPKLKFLFHTVFEINKEVLDIPDTNLSVLVKSVKLPNFNIETQVMNQYNRKRLNQTKIKYDPIDITFHDDSGNTINSLWYRYYTYYFKDGQNPQVTFNGARGAGPASSNGAAAVGYNDRTQYIPSDTGFQNWGYQSQGAPVNGNPTKKLPFFKNITVFGINRHEWMAYTLINPVITRFGHDTYDYEQANGIMSNSMTVDYETVVYNQGALEGGDKSGNLIKGFGDQTVYDKRVSPIAVPGGVAKIIGQGGLVDAAGGFVKDMAGGNILSAIKTAGTTYNTFKNVNFKGLIQSEITKGLTNALNSTRNPTRNTAWEIPVYGQSGTTAGTAGAPPPSKTQPAAITPAAAPVTFNAGEENVFNPGTTINAGEENVFNPTAGVQNPNPVTGQDTSTGVQGFNSSF